MSRIYEALLKAESERMAGRTPTESPLAEPSESIETVEARRRATVTEMDRPLDRDRDEDRRARLGCKQVEARRIHCLLLGQIAYREQLALWILQIVEVHLLQQMTALFIDLLKPYNQGIEA